MKCSLNEPKYEPRNVIAMFFVNSEFGRHFTQVPDNRLLKNMVAVLSKGRWFFKQASANSQQTFTSTHFVSCYLLFSVRVNMLAARFQIFCLISPAESPHIKENIPFIYRRINEQAGSSKLKRLNLLKFWQCIVIDWLYVECQLHKLPNVSV